MIEKLKKIISADELAYEEYLAREKYWHDELSKKAYAEYKLKVATEKGIEKGREEEKLKAKKEKLEIAKGLLGILDENVIAEKFQLSIDEINELKK